MTHAIAARAALIAAVSIAVVAGCGPDTGELAATGAWARPTPASATDGVIYMTLTSDTPDGLVAVDVPGEVAAATELHTSDAAAGGGHQHGAVGGDMVTMTPVEEVPLEPGTDVEFRPGGNHIMLVDLREPLASGDTFVATLRFSSGRSIDTTVQVSDNPPA
jgi:copper(I)-binding protein